MFVQSCYKLTYLAPYKSNECINQRLGDVNFIAAVVVVILAVTVFFTTYFLSLLLKLPKSRLNFKSEEWHKKRKFACFHSEFFYGVLIF
jgi:hypothetical protein